MISQKINGSFMSAGILSAIAASLCCITPVIALFAGSSSIASNFSWLAPARPYLIGLSIAVLSLAWYQKLKVKKTDDCDCVSEEKPKFLNSKTFLLIVTIFAALMMSFPSYAKLFFPPNEKKEVVAEKSNIQSVELNIKGMSCVACEEEVNNELYKLPGIIQSTVSYKNRNAIVKFDISKTTVQKITGVVNSTGYKVTNQTIKN